MANGRAASLETHDALAGEPYLAIGEIAGRAASARILTAAALTLDDIERVAGSSIETADELSFDRGSASLRARRRRRLGALILAEQTLAVAHDDAAALALARGVLSLGVARLPWTKALKQRRDRVMFLRRAEGDAWPDLSDEALAADPGWLAPFLDGKTKLGDIGADDLASALDAALPWDLARRLADEAPTHFQAPTGTEAPIDYEAEGGPSIALRVQELFGLNEHPAIAGGRIPLTLHLLSPAHRPIQITRDLPGFWRGSWAAVRADLRGRYPRHFWPEDPAAASSDRASEAAGNVKTHGGAGRLLEQKIFFAHRSSHSEREELEGAAETVPIEALRIGAIDRVYLAVSHDHAPLDLAPKADVINKLHDGVVLPIRKIRFVASLCGLRPDRSDTFRSR